METLQLPGFDELSTEIVQELYDPANRLASDPELAGRHQEFIDFVLDLYGIEPPSSELLPALACDAFESGIEEEELIERAKVVDAESLVVPSLQNLLERSRQQAADILRELDIDKTPKDKRTLIACDAIAQASYEGKTRKTGERYYEHPKRAAAMALHIFNRLEEEGYVIEPEFKNAVMCVDLLHDATEETMRSCKYYDPDRPKGFTPLLIREVFRQTGNPHGRIVASSLRYMTHYAKHPWAPDYKTYVMFGSSDFIFDLVKPTDMKDNLLHPKPITPEMDDEAVDKIREKRALYAELIGTLAINASRHTNNGHNKVWARRYFEILRDIKTADLPAMVETLNEYIYGAQGNSAHKNSVDVAA